MIAEALQALFIVMSFMGLGVGIGFVDFDRIPCLLNQHQGSAYSYPDGVAAIGPQRPPELIQHPNIVVSGPEFDPTQNPSSTSNPSDFNHSHKDSINFSVQCTDGVRTRVYFSAENHWTNKPESLISRVTARSARKLTTSLQHSLGHINCEACEAERLFVVSALIDPAFTFEVASEKWIQSRSFAGSRGRYVAPRTIQSYEEYVRALNRFFSSMPLERIHVGHIRQYQAERANGKLGTPKDELFARVCKWMKITPEQARLNPTLVAVIEARAARICKEEISPNKINQEIGVLCRILKRAGCWSSELEEYYEPLQREESDIPKALTPQEQAKWLEIAQAHQPVVYWYSLIAFRTTASNVEMRSLRLGDINLTGARISVQAAHAKNKFRIRSIPLAPDAVWATEQLIGRAREYGSTLPSDYLFPFRTHKNEWVPDKPMTVSGLKKPWQDVRVKSGLLDFSPHDCRHTAITRMAEAGTPIPVIMSMAGHMSRKMLQHYTQISDQAQRWAIDAVYQQKYYPVQNAARRVVRMAELG